MTNFGQYKKVQRKNEQKTEIKEAEEMLEIKKAEDTANHGLNQILRILKITTSPSPAFRVFEGSHSGCVWSGQAILTPQSS